MESTFMTQMSRAANLRSVLRHSEVKDALEEIITTYSGILNEDPRGTRIRDAMSLTELSVGRGVAANPHIETPLDPPMFSSLLYRLNYNQTASGRMQYVDERDYARRQQHLALHHASTTCDLVKIGGVSFRPKKKSLKDSNAMYVDFRSPGMFRAGRIVHIFLHRRPTEGGEHIEETFLAIRRLQELNEQHAPQDFFRKYGKDGGCLCYDRYEDSIDIVSSSEILCHFARTPYKSPTLGDCVHVLPLDRV